MNPAWNFRHLQAFLQDFSLENMTLVQKLEQLVSEGRVTVSKLRF
jgi:hypothetical protein